MLSVRRNNQSQSNPEVHTLHPFDEPANHTNQQTKQHKRPEVNKYIGDSLLISLSVTRNPIEANNHKAGAKNPHEYLKKQVWSP